MVDDIDAGDEIERRVIERHAIADAALVIHAIPKGRDVSLQIGVSEVKRLSKHCAFPAALRAGGGIAAAAVIAGSSLEGHLRQLAKRWGVPVERTTPTGDLEPKKADAVNAELVKANAYSRLDQKNVTAWLDLRNKAAHGHYTEYQKEQVALMIDAIRDFITRCPA